MGHFHGFDGFADELVELDCAAGCQGSISFAFSEK
jgi:hypothetical protein